MSGWFVNAEWDNFYAFDNGDVTFITYSPQSDEFSLDARDILSAPDVETLLPGGLALWPRGAAWGTPDGEAASTTSVIAGLTRALLAPFAALYAKAWQLTDEARSGSIVDSLDEWERDYGLPDPCVTTAQTDDERRRVLRVRVRGLPTITPADIVRLAASLGFVVALEEPDAFRCGESECGSNHEPSNTGLELQWVVHIRNAPSWRFEAGIGEAGVDRLLDFDNGALMCAIRRIAPAWTYPFVSVAPLPIAFALTTHDYHALATEGGSMILAVLPGPTD